MLANADITLYSLYFNPDKQKKEYRPTQIRCVHWHTEQKTQLDPATGDVKSADLYKVRIYPESDTQNRQYIDAKLYRKLPVSEVDKYWTVDNGSVFVKGLVDYGYEELEANCQYVGKVNSFSDNRNGLVPHIRIGGAS